MVMVPSQKTQRVATDPAAPAYQNPNAAPSAAFGGGQGLIRGAKGLSDAGDQMLAVAMQMQNEDNEAEARELDIKFNEALRGVTYGDQENGVEGYYSTKGKGALDQYPVAEDAIGVSMQEVLGQASNEAVRRMVAKTLEDRRQRALNDMTRHAQVQRQTYLDSLNEAREAQAFSDASLQWNNDATISRSLGIIEGEVEDWAKRNGVDAEVAAVRLQQRQSVAVKAAFDAATANGDTVRANRILSRYAEVLDGPTKAAMEKSVLQDTQSAQAQALAGSALDKFPNDPAAARAYIRSVTSGAKEDAAITEFNQRISEARGDYQFAQAVATDMKQLETEARQEANHQYTLKQRQEREALDSAQAAWGAWLYDENAATSRTVAQFRRENPEAFDVLSQNGKVEALQREARNVAEGQLFANATDGKTLAEIKSMPAAEREKLDPSRYRQQLTQSEFAQAVASVNSASAEMKRLRENPAPYNQADAAIEDFAPRSYGTGPNDKKRSANEAKAIQAAKSVLNDWITQQIEQGVRPSEPDIRREAARLMLRVQADTSPWVPFVGDFEGLAAQKSEMTPGQRAVARVAFDNIPTDVLNAIRAQAGGDVGDDLAEQLAGALAMGDRARFRALLQQAQGE